MGITHVTVRVTDLAREGTPFEDEFLVDTGAVDCMVPGGRLVQAGIQPEGKSVYELANGELVEVVDPVSQQLKKIPAKPLK